MTSHDQAKQILERLNAHHSMSQYANQEHLEAARTKDANIIAQALDAARRETWRDAHQHLDSLDRSEVLTYEQAVECALLYFLDKATAQADPTPTRELT